MITNKFVEQTGVGASESIFVLDTAGDLRISYAVVVTGSVTYSVQHSLSAEDFFDNTDNVSQTISRDGNYVFPVQEIRVNVLAGTGTAKLTVMQHIR